MIKAGDLNSRLVLRRPVESTHATTNEIIVNHVEWQSRWGRVRPMRAVEVLRNKQAGNEATVEIQLRWFPELRSDWLIDYSTSIGTHTYRIVGSPRDVDNGHVEWLLQCAEVTPNA